MTKGKTPTIVLYTLEARKKNKALVLDKLKNNFLNKCFLDATNVSCIYLKGIGTTCIFI